MRLRVCLSLLTGRPLRVEGLRTGAADRLNPGLREHEVSFLRLVEKVSNGTLVEINETGTAFRLRPGVVVGGKHVHDCGDVRSSRSIGWFLEPLILLALFAKRPMSITLRGATNDCLDPAVDMFRQTTLPLLRKLGVGSTTSFAGVSIVGADAGAESNSVYDETLELRLIKRGYAGGAEGGEMELRVPVVKQLPVIRLVDEGLVKRVRGVAYAINVTPQFSNRMVDGCRGVLNNLLPDVFIFTDHNNRADGGGRSASRGYGIVLNAETTSGCSISAGCDSRYSSANRATGASGGPTMDDDDGEDLKTGGGGGVGDGDGDGARQARDPTVSVQGGDGGVALPEDVGQRAARLLLEEVNRGGAVDSSHQALMVALAACGPAELHRFRLGPLSPSCIRALREIRRFLNVTFLLQPETEHTNTIIASCIGAGLSNVSKASR